MRTFFTIALISLLALFSSCHKDNAIATLPSRNMIFMDSTFRMVSFIADSNAIKTLSVLADGNTLISNDMTVMFSHALPVASGMYTVVNGIAGHAHLNVNEVYILLNISGAYGAPFFSAGSGSVSVSMANNKMTLSGTNIDMVFFDNVADSSKLSFNITQQ